VNTPADPVSPDRSGVSGASPEGARAPGGRRIRGGPVAVLTIFGPISLDLYLPALPQLAGDLSASASASQLTLTVCMVGLSLGQLVAGPWSDRFGRKRPLLVGIVLFVVASVLCGLAPNLTALLIFRFVQGLGGACGVVIAQAIGRDLYTGARLVGFYGRLAVLGGLAAIIGPASADS
jgi:MFS transporter, DHA1 family, multidrug resistance protein